MDYLREMWAGPGHLRFLLQPLLAILLGTRDGLNDARNHRPPYVLGLITERGNRRQTLIAALRRLAIPLSVGTTLSIVFQWVIRKRVHLLPAVLFGVVFVGLPYALARALSNRAARRQLFLRS